VPPAPPPTDVIVENIELVPLPSLLPPPPTVTVYGVEVVTGCPDA
jgi:hypothetical protein